MSKTNLSDSSKNDLIDFRNVLMFVSESDIKIYEAIEVIDNILNMSV